MSIKKLAGQTAWYGISSIAARFINYLLTPYLTYKLSAATYGEQSIVYSAIPFLNVIFTYGLETAYFRFSNRDGLDEKKVFSTASFSIIISTIFLTGLLLLFRQPIATLLNLEFHPEFIKWSAYVIALDTLTTLPFAKLRYDGRPRKYALIRVVSIFVNVGMVYFFYSVLPVIATNDPGSVLAKYYDPNIGAGYYIIANIFSSAIIFLILLPEFLSIRLQWSSALWKEMLVYSLPLMVAGFAGMINETFDRIMLGWWAPVATHEQKLQEVGIYAACYKLSLLISMFVQAFRMGAEPFFFQQSKGDGAQKTYARVMKFFVIAICAMFLFVALYIDVWKELIRNRHMWEGLKVVPILLIANMSLGVYYNLSIWYKLSHNTRAGATITIIGAAITLLVNYFLIPYYSYMACAWATLLCYGGMMVISYLWGQKVYPVPYATKRLLGYFGIMLALYFIDIGICSLTPSVLLHLLAGTVLFVAYILFIIKTEKEELKGMPVIGKWMK
ncbi:MAG: polysaccharide biosynthesis protein [Flavipsychrobacter sp.]|nr:polysaccharide biosynthesis protein [Flavipsychrobacter sp.]